MSQSCNVDMGNSLEGTSLVGGGGKKLVEKVVRNRGPDNFELSGQKLFGPHTTCAGQSRFHVLNLSPFSCGKEPLEIFYVYVLAT